MTPASLRIDDYDFDLPTDAIAQTPAAKRSASRLLAWRADGSYEHLRFADVEQLTRPGDLLVLNDTRVFAARIFGTKLSGSARVEALLIRPLADLGVWEAMLRPGRRLPPGTEVSFSDELRATVGEDLGEGRRVLRFQGDADVWDFCGRHGHVPLPPYIDRDDRPEDAERYQTVYSRERGSVAAPTAGLHFDEPLLERLEERGVEVARVTLHVGPGTFQPVNDARLARGELHLEEFEVPSSTLEALRRQRSRGGRVVAVGTTVCRTLESLREDDLAQTQAIRRSTRLLISPGFEFRWVDVLLTNFHLPKSSLLLLVAALAGPRWRQAYDLAISEGYRFYSYGDANWIERSTR